MHNFCPPPPPNDPTNPLQGAPFLIPKKSDDHGIPLIGNNRYTGYCVDLAEAVSDKVLGGLSYVIRRVKDGSYGSLQENGSWNGMVGEVVRRVSSCGTVYMLGCVSGLVA